MPPITPIVAQTSRSAGSATVPRGVHSGSGYGAYARTFDLVIEFGRVVAIICPARLKTAHLTNLYALLPERAALDHELARRWDCAHVLCAPDWAAAQKRRAPMFRPRHQPDAVHPSVVITLSFASENS